MKNKLISMIIAFAMFPCSLCYAAEPTVTRDYITRKFRGEKTTEEKILVNYSELKMEQGDYVTVSFYDKADNILETFKIEMSVTELFENEMFFSPDELRGTAYVEIKFVGPGYNGDGIKLPLNI